MNKVVAFLERNVQWVALGLGGLYVLWMAWTYILSAQVTTDIGSTTLGAGDIDSYIVSHAVDDLTIKMQNVAVPEMPDPAPLQSFEAALALSGYEPETLSGLFVNAPIAIPGKIDFGTSKQEKVLVEDVPKVPPAEMGEVASGASSVVPPGTVAAAGAPTAAAQTVAGGVDKIWTTVGFKINNKALAEAIQAVKLPAFMSRTSLLDVKLIRQEELPDGSWGNEIQVKKLSFSQAQTIPPEGPGQVENDKSYLTWADANQAMILQPAFYDVVQGDRWHMPGDAATASAVPVVQQAPFDPNKEYTPEELRRLTPEQLRQWQIAKAKRDEEARKAKAGAKPPRTPSGSGGRGGGRGGAGGNVPPGAGPGPNDPSRPANGGRSGAPSIPLPGNRPPVPGMDDGESPPPPIGGIIPSAPAVPNATNAPCPVGEFDPSLNPDWVGWAHDETVVPGHTFRYKVVYTIKNPLNGYDKYAKTPELAAIFGISSDPATTEWTKEVKVPSRTSFYMATNFRDGSPTVKFDVFTLQGGQKHDKMFEIAPGDSIGMEEAGTNYATGWMLVDMGKDRNGNSYVVLADPRGELTRHDFASDQANPDYANDKKAVVAGLVPAPALTPGAPAGMTPPATPAAGFRPPPGSNEP